MLDGGTAKKPTADQMEYGELAVNYNSIDPTIFIKDNSNTIIPIAGTSTFIDSNWDALPGDPGYIENKPDLNDLDYIPISDVDDLPYIPISDINNLPYIPIDKVDDWIPVGSWAILPLLP